MRIEGWEIEGFGALRSVSQRNLGPGLNVFVGPNEAGKSTLLEFMRGVLFGFPMRRGRPSSYAAPQGLRHGGRLFISTEDGLLTVERFGERNTAVRLIYADGRPDGADAELQQHLRQADDTLFRNVFAVSLTELQDFKTLSTSGVSDRIFSAGVAGAGRSAREAIKQLSESADTLFKPRAQSALINKALIDLEHLKQLLAAARLEAGRYTELLLEEETQATRMERLSASADEARLGKVRFDHLVELWPTWSQRMDAELRLADLPPVDSFPPQAAVRLAEALNRIATSRERVETQDAELAVRERRRDGVLANLQPSLLALAADVDELAQSVTLQRNNLREHLLQVRAIEEAQRTLDQKLLELGPGWDEARVQAFDVSIPRREELRQFGDVLQKAHESADAAQRRAEQLSRELEQKQREAERIRQKRDTLKPADAEIIANADKAIRRLRVTLNNLHVQQARAEALSARVRERELALDERREEEKRGDNGGAAPRWLPVLLCVAGVLVLTFGAWQALSGSAMTGGVVIATGLVFLMAALALAASAKRGEETVQARAENTARFELEFEELEAAEEKCAAEVAAIVASARKESEVLGLPLVISAEALENKAADVERQKSERGEWQRLDDAIREAVQACAELDLECRSSQQAATQECSALEAAEADWQRRRLELGVAEPMSPESLLQFCNEIDRARDLLRSRDQRTAAEQEVRREIDVWEARARAQFLLAGRERDLAATGDVQLTRFGELQRSCVEQIELQRTLIAIEQDSEGIMRQREAASAALERYQADLQLLFEEAGVENEAEFHRKLSAYEERRALQQQIAGYDNAIRTRVGESANLDSFRETLAEGHLQDWRDALVQLDLTLNDVTSERDQAVREHDAARRRRTELEQSTDIASFETQVETLRMQLESSVREWRTSTLACALLQETLAEFQRTRQPAVITEAGRAFASITAGRYTNLLPQDDGETLLVQMSSGDTRQLSELSRGTAEQLYLCLRLAFAGEFARRGCTLPVVMDDLLVNFDPTRSRAVARLLAEFSTANQVLLFTCHPLTAAIFEDEAPGHVRIDLQSTHSLTVAPL